MSHILSCASAKVHESDTASCLGRILRKAKLFLSTDAASAADTAPSLFESGFRHTGTEACLVFRDLETPAGTAVEYDGRKDNRVVRGNK